MPRIVSVLQLLPLLVLMQSRHVAGQAFFMDGAPGCSSDGYGITVDALQIECEQDHEDGACYFDDLVTISGTSEYSSNPHMPAECHPSRD